MRYRLIGPYGLNKQAPLRENNQEVQVYSVDGTPTDAVYMGVHQMLKERPILVVSGINHGANLGYDVLYSGTVSAAMKLVSLGITSVAVSLGLRINYNFRKSSRVFSRILFSGILKKSWPKATLFNVNVPKRVKIYINRGYETWQS